MFPRLLLAKNLLQDDGVIFISIDDNEVNHLRLICDEIFGEENTEIMVWHKVGDDSGRLKITYRFRREHEYILVIYKNKSSVFFNKFLSDRNYKNEYTNPDNDPRGVYKQGIISSTEAKSKSTGKNYFTVISPSGRQISRQWRVTEAEFKELVADNRIYFGKSGDSIPSLKVFVSEQKETTPISLLQDLGTAKSAGLSLRSLFNGIDVFDYPKPVELIRHFLKISTTSNDLILDFFSGSATTAQAVFEQNEDDNGNRNFILVQLPEPCIEGSEASKAGYKTIADIGKERIRRVIKILHKEQQEKIMPVLTKDIGFKSTKLTRSHFVEWEAYMGKEASQLELRFEKAEDPLIMGWKPENLLNEILLLQGFPLDSHIHPLPEFKQNDVTEVSSDFCQHRLYVCLDPKVQPESVSALHLRSEDILVCLDSALSDEAKIKLSDQCSLKVI
jgi:adenine-specific DNA-methyltransferase